MMIFNAWAEKQKIVPPPPIRPRLALHSQPASAAQSDALRNPAFAPLAGEGTDLLAALEPFRAQRLELVA